MTLSWSDLKEVARHLLQIHMIVELIDEACTICLCWCYRMESITRGICRQGSALLLHLVAESTDIFSLGHFAAMALLRLTQLNVHNHD